MVLSVDTTLLLYKVQSLGQTESKAEQVPISRLHSQSAEAAPSIHRSPFAAVSQCCRTPHPNAGAVGSMAASFATTTATAIFVSAFLLVAVSGQAGDDDVAGLRPSYFKQWRDPTKV